MAQTEPLRRLRSAQAAAYIGVAEQTLRTSRVTGLLCGYPAPVYYKMGRTIIYSVEYLDRWLEQLPKGNCTTELEL